MDAYSAKGSEKNTELNKVQINVSNLCMETFPCQHHYEVYLDDKLIIETYNTSNFIAEVYKTYGLVPTNSHILKEFNKLK